MWDNVEDQWDPLLKTEIQENTKVDDIKTNNENDN